MHPIDSTTQLCAVIGNPVAHSLSPAIHNAAFAKSGLNFAYLAFRVEDLKSFLAGMRAAEGFCGLSVTIPHKEEIIEYLDDVEPLARKVGSVNTVVHDSRGLRGSTTDGRGALKALEGASVDLAGKRVLFLGSGGAARAVAFAMADSGLPSRMTILGRTPSKVEALVSDLADSGPVEVGGGNLAEEIAESVAAHDVLVQSTPVGMSGVSEDESPVPVAALSSHHTVFDMVYSPRVTRLLRDAEAAGCTVVGGEEMFVHQAALQFELWTGQPAPITVMRNAFQRAADSG